MQNLKMIIDLLDTLTAAQLSVLAEMANQKRWKIETQAEELVKKELDESFICGHEEWKQEDEARLYRAYQSDQGKAY